MKRWAQTVAATTASDVDGVTRATAIIARAAAIKDEIARVWDTTGTIDEMLKYIEEWLAFRAPSEIRGCTLRGELHPLVEEVYRSLHPEDFGGVPLQQAEPEAAQPVKVEERPAKQVKRARRGRTEA